MQWPADEQFRSETMKFRLRMHCEDCALFEEDVGGCAHGYPTAPHRRSRTADEMPAFVCFCKDFDPV